MGLADERLLRFFRVNFFKLLKDTPKVRVLEMGTRLVPWKLKTKVADLSKSDSSP